ncbi:hypothetical protein [Mycobacteroides abscessus]|uniref:hypothetical protein n=1 Tax=Mycobacteroides abscessus TaxID=36809 RepID=UPI0021027D45|nr:hypothetical protein [Mycobacteroides abscessus]
MAPIDLDLFEEHTRGRGIVEVLLRGHLWLENAVIDLITVGIHNPEPLKIDRMTFANKVNLAEALGLLGPGEASTLRAFNRIRNRLAHDLHGEPTLDDLSMIEQGLSNLQRDMADGLCRTDDFQKRPADPDHMIRLSTTILALLADIEWHRQRHKYWKENRTSIDAYGIVAAIHKRYGRTPQTWDEWCAERSIPKPPSPEGIAFRARDMNTSE